MKKIARGGWFAERKTQLNKKIKKIFDDGYEVEERTDNVGKFNLEAIRDLFEEYNVDINRGVAFMVLLDTIKAKSYFNLVNDFYYNAADAETLLYKWDKTSCRQYLVRPTCVESELFVLQEDIELYLGNCQIYVQPDTLLEQKVQLLINHYFKEGFDRFVKRYEARINILKVDSSRNDVFNGIKEEMKSYLDFR